METGVKYVKLLHDYLPNKAFIFLSLHLPSINPLALSASVSMPVWGLILTKIHPLLGLIKLNSAGRSLCIRWCADSVDAERPPPPKSSQCKEKLQLIHQTIPPHPTTRAPGVSG